jgi:uncharacterized protein (UPF0335 family)
MSIYKKSDDDKFVEEINRLRKSQEETQKKIDKIFPVSNNKYSQNFDYKFKKKIMKRDNNQCQFPDCLIRDNLTVHHINYRKSDTSDDNCVTLCRNHNSFVNKKEERKIWEEYFRRLLHFKLNRGES